MEMHERTTRIYMKLFLRLYSPLLILVFVLSAPAQDYPFQDPNLPMEDRIDNILSLMTLDEKVQCLGTDPSVPRLGIRGSRHIEGLHGLARGGPSNWGQRDPETTTIFPQAIGLAQSWDTDLIQQAAAIQAYEARYLFQSENYNKGALVIRAPIADPGRDPRWGRIEESFGEDAWFVGTMATAFIRGLQGSHPEYWKTASLMKHFLANSNEDTRTTSSSDFDERLFREYYSLPFYMGVHYGGSQSFMAAYNAYNGIPMTVHPAIREVAVDEWGVDGIICTDAWAYTLLVTEHNYFPDMKTAAAACINAGISQFLDEYREGVYEAFAGALITEADIDEVIRGNYRVMIRLGLLDPPDLVPYSGIGGNDEREPWLSRAHQQTTREITQRTIVLLKNTDNFLPLDTHNLASIAVIGPLSSEVRLDWYSGTPPYLVTPLQGIRNKLKDNYSEADVSLLYARDNRNNRAVAAAGEADVAIVFVGNHPTCFDAPWGVCDVASDGREAVDRKSIDLEQEELIRQVYAANPNTIVVLVSSFPYAINWTQDHVPAILHITHSSQEHGNAIADVLFGDANPAGRLVLTWPRSIGQLPPLLDYDIRNGRTYMYLEEAPLYPFGYGLSYTSFEYSNPGTDADTLAADGTISISVDVQNTGDRTGDEVVQVYIRHTESQVDRPIKELRGFSRITMDPGELKTVSIPIRAETLAYWDEYERRFVVEEGNIEIMIGGSSADIRHRLIVPVVHRKK
jgi:beta-glucosidase